VRPDVALKFKRAELILLVIGLKCLLVWGGLRVYSAVASRAAVQTFEANEKRHAVAQADSSSATDVRLWSRERISAYQESVKSFRAAPIAVLRIQKIGLVAPVFNGTGGLILNRGVGRVYGTAKIGEAGNLAIAGHRDGFFRRLSQLSPGDAIELERLGSVDRYVVANIRVVRPKDVSVLKPSNSSMLTLITCFPFYFLGHAPERYIVTAIMDDSHDSLLAEKNRSSGLSGPASQRQ
jgi:sortase A